MTMAYGFFGKIPDRGDFIRHGLPQSFTIPLDAWWQQVLTGSRAILGAGWVDAWMEAPIWWFALAPGVCGPGAAAGLCMPSADKAGRLFPLTLAAVGTGWLDVVQCGGFLDGAEQAGLRALEDGGSPAALAAALDAAMARPGRVVAAPPPDMSVWWTEGCPRVAPVRHQVGGLPTDALFARMLQDS